MAQAGRVRARAAAGWLAGGGLEYGFKPNWTVKLEYDYLKLGYWNAPTVPAEWERDVQMIKMGINYKFEGGNSDDATRTPDDSTGSARGAPIRSYA
jgi:hypothetical protein